MSSRPKKMLAIVMALVLLIPVLVGAVHVTAQDTTTITWLTLSEWNIKPSLVESFEAANPDINVEIEAVPFNTLFEQIQVRMSAGNTVPDVMSVDVPLVAAYVYRGWLMPLEDTFTEEQLADFLPAAVEAGSVDGVLYAAPVATSTNFLFYNADLFARAGIEPPGQDDRITYEYIREIAPKLTFDENGDGTPDIWGFTWEQTNRIYQLQPLVESLGGQAIGDDGLTVEGIINGETWLKAFTYYSDMFNVLKVAPPDDTIGSSDLFVAGKLSMYIAGPWNINRSELRNSEFEWGVSRHPYFEGGQIATPTGSWHVGINANSQQAEAAKRFVQWMTSTPGAEIAWRAGSVDFPAQLSMLASFATNPEFAEKPMSYLAVAADEATQGPRPRAVSVGYLEYEQILQNTFTDIRTGTDVQEALNTAATRIESEMAKYR